MVTEFALTKPAGKKNQKHRSPSQSITQAATLGEFATAIVAEQYHSLIKQEPKVLADTDPEHLHQMRVSSRRLRTALQVFERVLALPKLATAKNIAALARRLGALRDLDVQLADLQERYRPNLPPSEQAQLDEVIRALKRQRRIAFANTEDALTRSHYRNLKAAFDTWLAHPRYTALAQLPLETVVPDLLNPLLAELLLHPGWLVQPEQASETEIETMHDLRKVCKHVRYQTEFFAGCYGAAFREWTAEIKTIQANLGAVQDSQVLQELLAEHLPRSAKLPQFQAAMQQAQRAALADWETTRQRYLEPTFRNHLRQLLLHIDQDAKRML